MPRTSNEPNPEAPKLTPAATEGTTSAAGTSSGRTEGSRDPAVRVVPFQSMPQSTQEELGKELFDNPLLSIDNVKKLADYMQWSFKYTKVNLLLLLFVYVEQLVTSDQSCFVQEVVNRSFLKSHALYKTVDNRKTLEQQNALIAKRLDESLAARNRLYEANRKHHLELCAMKKQIKELEKEKAKLQEQLQIAQAYEYFDPYLDIALPMI